MENIHQQDNDQVIDTSDGRSKPNTVSVYEKKLAIAFIIIPFAIAGALIRTALQRLETYPGSPVFGLVYAQWMGCFIMGIVTLHKSNLFLLYQPLHVGLSTGLCGSITTFSSWQYGIFSGFANIDGADHTRGKNVLAGISEFLVTLAMAFSGYHLGLHVGRVLNHCGLFAPLWKRLADQKQQLEDMNNNEKGKGDDNQRLDPPVPQLVPCGFTVSKLKWVDYWIIAFGILSLVAVIIAAIFAPEDQRELALTCVFAPIGALLRWYLSYLNSSVRNGVLVGTFAANAFGTLILAIIYLLRFSIPLSFISCNVLSALADGFCGCLTTISTFVVELSTLPLGPSYIYGLISVVVGQCFMFVIVGPYIWTHGVNSTC